MNKRVTLVAAGVQVTATGQSRALDYLREDAIQFRREWNYEDGDVEDTDDDVSENADETDVDVSVGDAEGRGERVWTGSATFGIVVAACDEAEAYRVARALLVA